MNKINVAIDGPAGAGKSTVARLVAEALGYAYVDTGAMYRAVTWKALEQGLSPEQTEQIVAIARSTDIRLLPGGSPQRILVDGTDVTEAIRTTAVSNAVSHIAQIPDIRRILVHIQQRMAREKGVVMDGRDIGTHVLPDAEVKIYLTASAKERARRRFEELPAEDGVTLEQLEQDIARRDRMDAERETSPLVRAPDAVLIDSTELTVPQVVDQILTICRTRIDGD